MKILIQNNLFVKKSPIHGYGVFAGKDFSLNEVIEECYTIETSGNDQGLSDYYFSADEAHAILTGFGSIYNHSSRPNVRYYYDQAERLMTFQAKQFIHKNEELLCSYGKDWFDARKMPVKKTPLWLKILRYTKGLPLRISIVLGGIFLIKQILLFLTE